jgi:hypothetical protein
VRRHVLFQAHVVGVGDCHPLLRTSDEVKGSTQVVEKGCVPAVEKGCTPVVGWGCIPVAEKGNIPVEGMGCVLPEGRVCVPAGEKRCVPGKRQMHNCCLLEGVAFESLLALPSSPGTSSHA